MYELNGNGAQATHGVRALRPLRLAIVARCLLHRQGLHSLLAARQGVHVVGSVGTARDALAVLRAQRPDVTIVDLADPRDVALAGEIASQAPGTDVIGVAMPDSEQTVVAAAEAGLAAFVAEDAGVEDVVTVMAAVQRGELPCSPRVAAILRRRLVELARDRAPAPAPTRLTARELDIMALVQEGRSNRDIAQRLCIEVSTVKNHLHKIFDKLDVHNRAEALERLRTSTTRGTSPSRTPRVPGLGPRPENEIRGPFRTRF
jgi:two-component system nitrate/nitrite response regulator NarL